MSSSQFAAAVTHWHFQPCQSSQSERRDATRMPAHAGNIAAHRNYLSWAGALTLGSGASLRGRGSAFAAVLRSEVRYECVSGYELALTANIGTGHARNGNSSVNGLPYGPGGETRHKVRT